MDKLREFFLFVVIPFLVQIEQNERLKHFILIKLPLRQLQLLQVQLQLKQPRLAKSSLQDNQTIQMNLSKVPVILNPTVHELLNLRRLLVNLRSIKMVLLQRFLIMKTSILHPLNCSPLPQEVLKQGRMEPPNLNFLFVPYPTTLPMPYQKLLHL